MRRPMQLTSSRLPPRPRPSAGAKRLPLRSAMISARGRTRSGSFLDAIGHAYDLVLAGSPLEDELGTLADLEGETSGACSSPIGAHVRQLAALHRLLQERRDDAVSRLAILDRLPFGIIILDAHGHERDHNRMGRALLDKYPVLAGKRGAIMHVRVGDDAIDRLTRPTNSAHDRLPFRAARVTALGGRSVWLVSWRVSKHGVTGPSDSIIVALSDGNGLEPSRTILRACFGLTPAEARVAALIASGRDTKDVARILRISRNAVRFHLKHVLSKTSSPRQADLVRRLLSSPATLLEA